MSDHDEEQPSAFNEWLNTQVGPYMDVQGCFNAGAESTRKILQAEIAALNHKLRWHEAVIAERDTLKARVQQLDAALTLATADANDLTFEELKKTDHLERYAVVMGNAVMAYLSMPKDAIEYYQRAVQRPGCHHLKLYKRMK